MIASLAGVLSVVWFAGAGCAVPSHWMAWSEFARVYVVCLIPSGFCVALFVGFLVSNRLLSR